MSSNDHILGQKLQNQFEPHPDPQVLTGKNDSVDYEPHPEKSVKVSSQKESIVKRICRLYSGSANQEGMEVYASEAVYDDPWSYCDTRYKIAGQWYGIPKIFHSETLKTELLSPSDTDPKQIVFKLQQKYTVKVVELSKVVNSLVSLTLDDEGKVRYHKDMWNEKDYSHEGIGRFFKELNGDHLTKITQPPKDL